MLKNKHRWIQAPKYIHLSSASKVSFEYLNLTEKTQYAFQRFAVEIDVESLPTNSKHVTSIDLAVDGNNEVICRIGIHIPD